MPVRLTNIYPYRAPLSDEEVDKVSRALTVMVEAEQKDHGFTQVGDLTVTTTPTTGNPYGTDFNISGEFLLGEEQS